MWPLQPRLFAQGHYVSYDGLLSRLWLGASLAFANAVEGDSDRRRPGWGSELAFGLLAGAAAGPKLTGWFLPLPFLAWTVLCRDRRGARALLVAAATLYACTPPWWADPVSGIIRILRSNLVRHETISITVPLRDGVRQSPKPDAGVGPVPAAAREGGFARIDPDAEEEATPRPELHDRSAPHGRLANACPVDGVPRLL